MFQFRGELLNSKSWANRALVIQYFNPHIKLNIDAQSEDVFHLKKSIELIRDSNEFDLGLGGTSLRFFLFLISRSSGTYTLKAHRRLLDRPQQQALDILKQLGVSSDIFGDSLIVHSKGWQATEKIFCSGDSSSQFVSGLLLSCWKLNFDLHIEIKKPLVSFGYLKMTLELLRKAGMKIIQSENEDFFRIEILKNQTAAVDSLNQELDISSAFALAAAGLIDGEVEILNWNQASEQPDLVFLELFKKMNINYFENSKSFKIAKQNSWSALDCDLSSSPDLFPVLAVLCAFANGVSTLRGAAQLKHKESDRIVKTQELLNLIQVKTEILPDGLRIFGEGRDFFCESSSKFDPDHDHRMAMAAGLVKLLGFNVSILHPEVVNKSYPSFWKDVGLNL